MTNKFISNCANRTFHSLDRCKQKVVYLIDKRGNSHPLTIQAALRLEKLRKMYRILDDRLVR
jgi:hypothetical protein